MTQEMLSEIENQTWPKQGEWTYQDYLNLPDDGRRYEIIEGVLYVTNAPNIDHQFTVMKTAARLDQFVTEHELGFVLTAPFEIHLSETTRPVLPDVILFIAKDRWPGPGAAYFEGAPDLIVEVLSPSTSRTDRAMDRVIKFEAYEQAGVREYWIANPKTRSVEVFVLSSGEYALLNEFVGEEEVTSSVLAGLKVGVNVLFNPVK